MKRRMTREEILRDFGEAKARRHIYPHFQPQYNHVTGRIIGAEALMRWEHPEFGWQMPNYFVPVLEKEGLIVEADLLVFEEICQFQRDCIDRNVTTVPISFNVSRVDIYESDYAERLERIRQRYDIPVRLLRAEITETSAIGGLKLVSRAMAQLQERGFVVEMDDFGTGYSSLNILKDLPFDIIKLDMRFLEGDLSGRGGTILNAMVQMTKWLETPIIAEGVETVAQANYLKSIGCVYVQGYLYARPMPGDEFLNMLATVCLEPTLPSMQLVDNMDANRFWDPDSLETLIFSNYVGAAAILGYEHGKVEVLRVNEKYVQELGMNSSERDAIYVDLYRDWHRQLEEGVGELEAIIPLTVGRVPFHVRYTTEFDENGRPLKAYGSATLVVDD